MNQYNSGKQNLEKKIGCVDKKILDTSSLVTTTVLSTKIIEVENKIPNNSTYITTQEFNKLAAENFTARLKPADLVNKTDFDNKLTNFNKRITSNKTRHLEVQNKLNSLIIFLGRIYFTSNYGKGVSKGGI